MKTTSLIKIATVILLGISVNVTAHAEKDRYLRYSNPTLARIQGVALSGDNYFQMPKLLTLPGTIASLLKFSEPIEGWMVEPDYLNSDAAAPVEFWMLDEKYLNEEVSSLESWMINQNYLSAEVSAGQIEPWMLEQTYLSR